MIEAEIISQCEHCRHLGDFFTCPAYPDGIPVEVKCNDILHTKVLDDQVGDTIREPKPGGAPEPRRPRVYGVEP